MPWKNTKYTKGGKDGVWTDANFRLQREDYFSSFVLFSPPLKRTLVDTVLLHILL